MYVPWYEHHLTLFLRFITGGSAVRISLLCFVASVVPPLYSCEFRLTCHAYMFSLWLVVSIVQRINLNPVNVLSSWPPLHGKRIRLWKQFFLKFTHKLWIKRCYAQLRRVWLFVDGLECRSPDADTIIKFPFVIKVSNVLGCGYVVWLLTLPM